MGEGWGTKQREELSRKGGLGCSRGIKNQSGKQGKDPQSHMQQPPLTAAP